MYRQCSKQARLSRRRERRNQYRLQYESRVLRGRPGARINEPRRARVALPIYQSRLNLEYWGVHLRPVVYAEPVDDDDSDDEYDEYDARRDRDLVIRVTVR